MAVNLCKKKNESTLTAPIIPQVWIYVVFPKSQQSEVEFERKKIILGPRYTIGITRALLEKTKQTIYGICLWRII